MVTEAADAALLDYAEKLTVAPWSVTREDTDGLRRHGFDDTAILDAAQVAAYFAYVNRIANGLGVELEEHRSTDTDREP